MLGLMESFKFFKNIDDSRPLHMLNIFKLKKEVIYPNDKITTGFEAYRGYGREIEPGAKNWEAQSFGEGIC